ncbi:MAG: hypothetical protein NVSMB9_00650 [Isosphaeraceae bacterium]
MPAEVSTAQSVGEGSSPGRASYRPAEQWNDGPFYTATHWDAFSPHQMRGIGLFAQVPLAPPFSMSPHGMFDAFSPGQGPLFEYAEGFSPYSGYSEWYLSQYRIQPTTEDLVRARAQFFRSAPRPPEGVLPDLPEQRRKETFSAILPLPLSPAGARKTGKSGKVYDPGTLRRSEVSKALPIYRSLRPDR